tara:strand:+ start:840 stop:1421 length:582 start_codon:yes stop_codon:yes gene_type:complete
MKKTINLQIQDYRDSFNEPHKKEPYFLFIEYGEKRFTFSNKTKAKRFLAKFKSESTNLFKELGYYMSDCFALNISSVHILPQSDFVHISQQLGASSERFAFVLNSRYIDISIGREINNIYYTLENVYSDFIVLLQKNNRSRVLLLETMRSLKSIRRLRKDLDTLLTNADGINEIMDSEPMIRNTDFVQVLKIA